MHALVLAGGKGTRSLDPSLPKILQKVDGDRRILDVQLDEIQKSGVASITFLLGHGSERVIEELEIFCDSSTLAVDWLIDRETNGTKGAVLNAVEQYEAEQFVVLLGDVVIQGGLRELTERYLASETDFGIACHANLHPQDSDRLILDENFHINGFQEKNSALTGEYAIPQTGVLFFSRRAASELRNDGQDISSSLARLYQSGLTGIGLVTSTYLKDSGTPNRLESIRRDYMSRSASRRGSFPRPAIFIDRDGTLIPDQPNGRSVVQADELLSGTVLKIAQANEAGIPIFLVTNQPAIAKGQLTFNDVNKVHADLARFMAEGGAYFDEVIFCPHHPETGFVGEIKELKIICGCRKPRSGMAIALGERHGIDFRASFVIGDSEADEGFASSIGAKYLPGFYDLKETVPSAIALAIDRICS